MPGTVAKRRLEAMEVGIKQGMGEEGFRQKKLSRTDGWTPRIVMDEQREHLCILVATAKRSGQRVNPNYGADVQNWAVDLRGTLVEFMVDVGSSFKYDTETVALAVSYFDRFLSHNKIDNKQLRPFAAVCLFVAGKYLENWNEAQSLEAFQSCFGCTSEAILEQEMVLLKYLEWAVGGVTAQSFIRCFCWMAPAESQERMLRYGELFVDLLMCERSALRFSPLVRAAASFAAAAHIVGVNTERFLCYRELLSSAEALQVESCRELLAKLYESARSSYTGCEPVVVDDETKSPRSSYNNSPRNVTDVAYCDEPLNSSF